MPKHSFGTAIFDPMSDMALVRQGKGFIANLTGTSGAAQDWAAVIWNPADSGVYAYINRLLISSTSGGNGNVEVLAVDPALTALGTATNRLVGGAASAMKLEGESVGASPAGTVIAQWSVTGGTLEMLLPDAAIVCPPGSGIAVVGGTASITFLFSVFWYEIAT